MYFCCVTIQTRATTATIVAILFSRWMTETEEAPGSIRDESRGEVVEREFPHADISVTREMGGRVLRAMYYNDVPHGASLANAEGGVPLARPRASHRRHCESRYLPAQGAIDSPDLSALVKSHATTSHLPHYRRAPLALFFPLSLFLFFYRSQMETHTSTNSRLCKTWIPAVVLSFDIATHSHGATLSQSRSIISLLFCSRCFHTA